MKSTHNDLQQLKGIGDILSQRLAADGLNNFAKIVKAGSKGLSKIKGINPHMIAPILKQARQLAKSHSEDKGIQVNELRQSIFRLRDMFQEIVAATSDRLAGKAGRKIIKNIIQIQDALKDIEKQLPKQFKKVSKVILKAEKQLTELRDICLPQAYKGIKKTRRKLEKVLE